MAKRKITDEDRKNALEEFYELSSKIRALDKELKSLKEDRELTLSYIVRNEIKEFGPYHMKETKIVKKEVNVSKVFDALGKDVAFDLVSISQKSLIDRFGKQFPIDDYCTVVGESVRHSIYKDDF